MKASVELEDLFGSFGTAEFLANEATKITCVAKHARPAGQFSWRVEVSGREPEYLTNNLEPEHVTGNGVFTTTQVILETKDIFKKCGKVRSETET